VKEEPQFLLKRRIKIYSLSRKYKISSVEVADITPIASGTDIKFYHKSGIFSYRTDARVDVIKHCI